MSQMTIRRTISRIGPLQIAILVLAVITALVHLDRGITTSAMLAHPVGHGGGPGAGGPRGGGPRGGAPGGFLSPILTALPLPILFYLDFISFIILAAALYLPPLQRYQRLIRWLLIALTIVTIIAWFAFTSGRLNLFSYIDKPVEIALIILLVIEDRQASLNKG